MKVLKKSVRGNFWARTSLNRDTEKHRDEKKETASLLWSSTRKFSLLAPSLRQQLVLVLCLYRVKSLANEGTLLRTHCCRHKCFPFRPRAQHLLRTQIVSGTQKMFLILLRNILCPQQMFPSLRTPRNIMGNNVSAIMCPRLPGLYGNTIFNQSARVSSQDCFLIKK